MPTKPYLSRRGFLTRELGSSNGVPRAGMPLAEVADEAVLSREQAAPGEGGRVRHQAFLPVLITLTLRKRAGGEPWLTALLCEGCPLPSKKLPPSW